MFTGLVEATGVLLRRAPADNGSRLTISDPRWTEGLEPGSSVAVDGCCLTVTDRGPESFTVLATRETLARTRFSQVVEGDPLNLERPLRVGDRLGGHWVQGHVDDVLPVTDLERAGETSYLSVHVSETALDWVVAQGSIALNGVSLTVLDVEGGRVRVAIIPYTWESTNLSRLHVGAAVNVEYDVLAKYVAAILGRRRSPAEAAPESRDAPSE